ncbi:MAG: thioesterase family protein [Bacteroidales bacterium]|nr:thioesterase family protein [Bacteroidales bacterium]
MISTEYYHRVIYADTDAMGVMYYANYLKVYEAARGDLMRKIGFSFSDMGDKGIICPAISVNIKYHKFAKFDQEVKIVSTIKELPVVKLEFEQIMYSADGEVLNKAVVRLGFVDEQRAKAVRCPQWILKIFADNF